MMPELAATAVITGVHAFLHKIRYLKQIPRSQWLSFASGVSVAYVFMHLLPETYALRPDVGIKNLTWLIMLGGFTGFYALESFIKKHHQKDAQHYAFKIHLGGFAAYSFILGYLLHHEAVESLLELALYTSAVAFHFIVVDFSLMNTYRQMWLRLGRWALSIGWLTGFAIAFVLKFSPLLLHGMAAFLAGGILLNVIKEELPQERNSRLLPFIMGSAFYAGLLLLQ